MEGADGRVVRGLLGQVGDADGLGLGGGGAVLGHREGDGRGTLVALAGFDAPQASLGTGLGESRRLDPGRIILGLPVALRGGVSRSDGSSAGGRGLGLTRKNSPRTEL